MGVNQLHDTMGNAWDIAWTRFFRPETNLFYDRISSKDLAHSQDHLPSVEEVRRGYPNVCGWGTGMEDSAICSGVWMATLCDRFDATDDWGMKAYADKVWSGMARLAAISRSPGFIPRSASPADGESHYINSSRDQYTHYVHGLWRFYHSPLSDNAQREAMRNILTAICERMERNVIPENDYSLCREDGKPGKVDKMWEVWCHEWARLPMIYIVGWDMTRDGHWRDLYQRTAWKAARESIASPIWFRVAYAYMQAVFSLEPLVSLENHDPALRSAWTKAMHFYANRMEGFTWTCLNGYKPQKIEDCDPDWRHWERHPMDDTPDAFCPVFPNNIAWDYDNDRSAGESEWIREPSEALLAQLMVPDRPLSADQRDLLLHLLHQTDYDACITYGLFFTIAAYWRAIKCCVL